VTFFWQNQNPFVSNPQRDYVTKQGKHGTLYLHAIEYDDPSDRGFLPDIWRTYAYDFEHALDRFYEGDQFFRPRRIARVRSDRGQHRWNWHPIG